MKHAVTVDYTETENDDGRMQDCVYVTCEESDITVGPIWGHSDASVKRACVELRDECEDCFHVAE